MQKVVRTNTTHCGYSELQRLLDDGYKVVMCNGILDRLEYIVEKEEKKDKKVKEVRHKYGEYKHVLLTDSQYQKLVNEFPNTYEQWIDKVDSYCEQHNKTYSNYLLVIKKWAEKEEKKGKYNSTKIVDIDF